MSSGLKFVIGCGGVYASFIGYGIFQEKLFKSEYPSINDENDTAKFTFAFPILLFQTFFAAIIGYIASMNSPDKVDIPLKIQAKQGIFNSISMLGSNTALSYVSYPVQALFKSCKVLSVLVVGLFFGQFKYRNLQYVSGILVTIGIVGFNLQGSKQGGQTSFTGIALLVASLFSDGMLANAQNDLRVTYKPNSFQLMYITSKFSSIIALCYGLITGQFFQFISFCALRPAVISDLFVVSLSGSVGQIFIFYTIKHFGPNILAIITTTRKLITVICSIMYYSHPIATIQWICISVVFGGVFLEFYDGQLKKKEQKLAKKAQEEGTQLEEKQKLKQLELL